MRRFSIVLLATILMLGGALAADAVRSQRLAEDATLVQNAWMSWALGSSTNPLLQDDLCGELVGGRFFLNVAVAPGRATMDCEVPAGTELVATPGGAFGWRGPARETDDELFSGNLKELRSIVLTSVKVKVDGALIPRPAMVCPDPIVVEIHPESFLAEVDPGIEGDTTRVTSCAWFHVLGPLGVGEHTILLSDKFEGEKRYEVLYRVTVG
jgi:hypothetical protein